MDVEPSILTSMLFRLSWRSYFAFLHLRWFSFVDSRSRSNRFSRIELSDFLVNTNSRDSSDGSFTTRSHYRGYSKSDEICNAKNHSKKTTNRSTVRWKPHYWRRLREDSHQRDYAKEESDEEAERNRWRRSTKTNERVAISNIELIHLSILSSSRPRKKPVSSTEKENPVIDQPTYVHPTQMTMPAPSFNMQCSQNVPYQYPVIYQTVPNPTNQFAPSHSYGQSMLSQQPTNYYANYQPCFKCNHSIYLYSNQYYRCTSCSRLSCMTCIKAQPNSNYYSYRCEYCSLDLAVQTPSWIPKNVNSMRSFFILSFVFSKLSRYSLFASSVKNISHDETSK